MFTAYITHPACRLHQAEPWHPEAPGRLHAIDDRLHAAHLHDHLRHYDAPAVSHEALLRVHDAAYLARVEAAVPARGLIHLDGDTALCPHSLEAARRAAGAAVLAVDLVLSGEVENAFCAVRPPGHHATRDQAMGFCIYNNVAVGAAHALAVHGLARVAIVDIDVHHGNGTEAIFRDEARVLFCSTFQHPYYPHCGADTVSDHIVNIPLPAGTDGEAYRAAFEARVLPALERFQPECLFISAGFDGHAEDAMADFLLLDKDYAWITERLKEVAQRHARGRMVSLLEGGYELNALGRAAAAHVKALAGL